MAEIEECSQRCELGYTLIFRNESNRKISDPIYDFLYFDQNIWKVIDNPIYQRLRHIKQLGATDLVFQGASHTRFEHCLGVGHLAQQFITSLYKNQPDLNDEKEKKDLTKLVTIAGIVHDLGHGPFSHMFDNILIPKLTGNTNWSHEIGSEKLFEYIYENYDIQLEKSDVNFINCLVQGDVNRVSSGKKQWIYDIVSNKRNGIDVDRIDYLRRDCHHLGMAAPVKDFNFLMEEARVIDDEICYPQKYALNIYDIFNSRYKLYKTVYLNRVSQALEQMLCDILISVNDIFHFEQIIHEPEQYYKLNDTIIEQIDNTTRIEFEKAQSIIKRIKTRNLYKFVSESLVSSEKQLDSNDKIKNDIYNYVTASSVKLEDIYVSQGKVGFGGTKGNPIDNVSFYKRNDPKQKFQLKKEYLSYCLPSEFCEKFIRVFVSDQSHVFYVEKAFEEYCKNKLGSEPLSQDRYTPIPSQKQIQPISDFASAVATSLFKS